MSTETEEEVNAQALALENAKLRTELASLRQQLEQTNNSNRRYKTSAGMLFKVVRLFGFGMSVNSALEDIEKSYRESDAPRLRRVPFEQWTRLIGSFMNRQFWTTIIIGISAGVPAVLTYGLMHAQNAKIDKQIYLSQQSMASQFSGQVSSLLTAISQQSEETCIDMKALAAKAKTVGDFAFAHCWSQLTIFPSSEETRFQWLAKKAELAGDEALRKTYAEREEYARKAEENRGHKFPETFFSSGANITPSADVTGQAHAITNALTPYRLIVEPLMEDDNDSSPMLTARAYSPERGLILKQFLQNAIDVRGNFRHSLIDGLDIAEAYAGGLDISDSLISCSSVRKTNLQIAKFNRADVRASLFADSDLRFTDWTMATLEAVVFKNTAMPSSEQFAVRRLSNVTFSNVTVESGEWAVEVARLTPTFRADSVQIKWNDERKVFLMNSRAKILPDANQATLAQRCANSQIWKALTEKKN